MQGKYILCKEHFSNTHIVRSADIKNSIFMIIRLSHGCLFVSAHINYCVCMASIIEIEHNHNISNACTASAHYTSSQFGDGARPFVYYFYCNGYEDDIHLCQNISYLDIGCSRESAIGVRCHHGRYQNET